MKEDKKRRKLTLEERQHLFTEKMLDLHKGWFYPITKEKMDKMKIPKTI